MGGVAGRSDGSSVGHFRSQVSSTSQTGSTALNARPTSNAVSGLRSCGGPGKACSGTGLTSGARVEGAEGRVTPPSNNHQGP